MTPNCNGDAKSSDERCSIFPTAAIFQIARRKCKLSFHSPDTFVNVLINAHHPWMGGVRLEDVFTLTGVFKMAQKLASLGTRLAAKSVTSARSEFLEF